MIAFEIRRNGKCVCVAGAEDLGVLAAHVTACGMLGRKTMPSRPGDTTFDVSYSVGGLTSRPDPKKDVHLRWKPLTQLRVGDVVQIKVLETSKADPPKSRVKAARKNR
jgi:hypothetical protein